MKDGERFFRAAKSAAGAKPVVVLKSGRSELGAQAAASHTGSLAGSDAVFDAVCGQTGMIRVGDFPEFIGALRAFDMCSAPKGDRIGVVSITGVGCVLAADACGESGMRLADISDLTKMRLKAAAPDWASVTNPADIWSTIEQLGPADAFARMSEAMIEDDSVDILLLIFVLLEEGYFDAAASLGPIVNAHRDKPVLACFLGGRKDLLENFQSGLENARIPCFDSVSSAVRAASFLSKRAQRSGMSIK